MLGRCDVGELKIANFRGEKTNFRGDGCGRFWGETNIFAGEHGNEGPDADDEVPVPGSRLEILVLKSYIFSIFEKARKARVFVPGKPFQPAIKF